MSRRIRTLAGTTAAITGLFVAGVTLVGCEEESPYEETEENMEEFEEESEDAVDDLDDDLDDDVP